MLYVGGISVWASVTWAAVAVVAVAAARLHEVARAPVTWAAAAQAAVETEAAAADQIQMELDNLLE